MASVTDDGCFDPLELVDYQQKGIVSRILLKEKAGTVTRFAFDEGQEVSEHSAPFDALVHVLDGEGEIVIAGKAHRVAQGRMIVLPANVPHAVRAPKRFKMLLTMIRA
ncbi:MAG: cupin domain-containing protein [Planctomycetes bacterium]|nr:cupin domain-containing protein [Planctomycetota bacterium]